MFAKLRLNSPDSLFEKLKQLISETKERLSKSVNLNLELPSLKCKYDGNFIQENLYIIKWKNLNFISYNLQFYYHIQ